MEKQTEDLLFNYLSQYEKDDPVVREILALRKEALLSKTADVDILGNSMWSNLLDAALKGLTIISAATFDWKLLTITQLLKSWISDKQAEHQKKQQDLTLGVNYNITHPGVSISPNSQYGQGTYY